MRGNNCFHVVLSWNTLAVFVGYWLPFHYYLGVVRDINDCLSCMVRFSYMQVLVGIVHVAHQTDFFSTTWACGKDGCIVLFFQLFLCFNQSFNHFVVEWFTAIIMQLCQVVNKWIINVGLSIFIKLIDDRAVQFLFAIFPNCN